MLPCYKRERTSGLGNFLTKAYDSYTAHNEDENGLPNTPLFPSGRPRSIIEHGDDDGYGNGPVFNRGYTSPGSRRKSARSTTVSLPVIVSNFGTAVGA